MPPDFGCSIAPNEQKETADFADDTDLTKKLRTGDDWGLGEECRNARTQGCGVFWAALMLVPVLGAIVWQGGRGCVHFLFIGPLQGRGGEG